MKYEMKKSKLEIVTLKKACLNFFIIATCIPSKTC